MKRNDILSIQGIKNNPLSVLIINKYTIDNKVDLNSLINDLNAFCSNNSSFDKKLSFIFKLYDTDNDGLISSVELYNILYHCNKGILSGWKLQNIIDKTYAEIGEYTTEMNYEQFKRIILKRNTNLENLFRCKT